MTIYAHRLGIGWDLVADAVAANIRQRAVELANQAQGFLGRAPMRFNSELQELDAWLEDHEAEQ